MNSSNEFMNRVNELKLKDARKRMKPNYPEITTPDNTGVIFSSVAAPISMTPYGES